MNDGASCQTQTITLVLQQVQSHRAKITQESQATSTQGNK